MIFRKEPFTFAFMHTLLRTRARGTARGTPQRFAAVNNRSSVHCVVPFLCSNPHLTCVAINERVSAGVLVACGYFSLYFVPCGHQPYC